MKRAPTFKPRLATENGRRVGKVPKSKRLAAQPVTDAARLMRSLAMIRAELAHHERRAKEAEGLLHKALSVSRLDDPVLMRAMARELCIEVGFALNLNNLAHMVECAEAGTLCA